MTAAAIHSGGTHSPSGSERRKPARRRPIRGDRGSPRGRAAPLTSGDADDLPTPTPRAGRAAMTAPHPRGTWIDPADGAILDQRALMERMGGMEAVLLGETHNVAEIHRWQAHVIAHLQMVRPNVAVGFEMFPRRLQPVLDRWVAGELTTEAFIEQSEWWEVWGFPPEIYLPIFHLCRAQRLPMLALNCHRPLVTRVGKEGWDAIPETERDGLTPAAPATPEYRRYLHSLVGGGAGGRGDDPMDPSWDRFVRAQQCWDRAFACNIARALDGPEPPLVVGIIGRGHLEYGGGTPFQLRDLGVEKVGVLLPSEDDAIDLDRAKGIGDAVFRIDRPEPPVDTAARRKAQEDAAKARAASEGETAAE